MSSISICFMFWSVNHTLIDKNSVFVVIDVNERGAISINWPNCLFDTKVNKTLDDY